MVEQATPALAGGITMAEVRALCRDLLQWKMEAILAAQPTAAEVAAAVAWAGGQDDLGQEGHPLMGAAAQLYDMLLADESYGDEAWVLPPAPM